MSRYKLSEMLIRTWKGNSILCWVARLLQTAQDSSSDGGKAGAFPAELYVEPQPCVAWTTQACSTGTTQSLLMGFDALHGLPWVLVCPSSGLGWQQHELPTTAMRGVTNPLPALFYSQRWIKSSLGREAAGGREAIGKHFFPRFV